jgi:hypothetical protein
MKHRIELVHRSGETVRALECLAATDRVARLTRRLGCGPIDEDGACVPAANLEQGALASCMGPVLSFVRELVHLHGPDEPVRMRLLPSR